MLKLLLSAGFFIASSAYACQVDKIRSLNLAVSTDQQAVSIYQDEGQAVDIPVINVSNCQGNKFLMIALGPEVMEFDDNTRGLNFTGEFGNRRCELSGSPFPVPETVDRRVEKFGDDWKFIKSCVDVVVEEGGPQDIRLPNEQVGCDLKQIGKKKISFNGGYCFLKPSFNSSISVELKIKPACQNAESLKKLSLKVNELSAGLNFYTAGDASGNSLDLTALSNTQIKFSINPLKKLIPASEDYGLIYPTFPEVWTAPDIHLSKMILHKTRSGQLSIETPFLVNNNCSSKCDGNLCQSPCDYSQPIVGEFSLYEMNKGKKEIITSWHDGGIAPGRYQGVIRGIQNELPLEYLEVGKKYLIESVFLDPKYDYEIFKKRIRSILTRFNARIGGIGNSGIPGIGEVPVLGESQTLPSLGTIPDIIFDEPIDDVSRVVRNLRSLLSFRLWPPYYTNICNESNCIIPNKNFLTLGVEFEVTGLSEEEVNYKIINNYRKSHLVPEYNLPDFHLTSVSCTEIE